MSKPEAVPQKKPRADAATIQIESPELESIVTDIINTHPKLSKMKRELRQAARDWAEASLAESIKATNVKDAILKELMG